MPGPLPPPNLRFSPADRRVLADAKESERRAWGNWLGGQIVTANGLLSLRVSAEDLSAVKAEVDKLAALRAQAESGDARLDEGEKRALSEQVAATNNAEKRLYALRFGGPTNTEKLLSLGYELNHSVRDLFGDE
jgi:hypothetical protein